MISLEKLKIGWMYESIVRSSGRWNSNSGRAVYKGNGEFWTSEYDMLPNGENDYHSGPKLRTRKYGPQSLSTVEPRTELGKVEWSSEEELVGWLDDWYCQPRLERKNMLRVEIDPRWRTAVVIDLCRAMFESGEWARLPILADALMDAGCDNQELISACQSEKESAFAMRIAANVLGGEHAEAIKWLEQFADSYNFSWTQMIAAGDGTGDYVTAMGRDLHGAGELDSGEEDKFWEYIYLLTGKRKREDDGEWHDNIWSCSC